MYKSAAFAALITVLASSLPVHAQSIEIGPNGIRLLEPESDRPRYREDISERRAARIAQREGMDEIDSVSRRRDVYIVRGVDRYDDEMRVVIDRYSGEVLQVR